MTIQEALETLVEHTKTPIPILQEASMEYWSSIRLAAGIAEIMLTEEAFFTAYQSATVEEELKIQAEEAE